MAETEYLVLRRDESRGWVEIGIVRARSPKVAIRERVGGVAQTAEFTGEGEYVAVPKRSWKPEPVTVEHRTEVKVG